MTQDKSMFEQNQAGEVAADIPPEGTERYTGNRGFFGHPTGLSTLFFTEMWERFSYYGLRPLLVLFMSATIMNGGYGFDRTEASAIVGIYAAFVYLMSLPGGWVADRLLGLRRAIFIGAALISSGHICIGLSGLLGTQSGKVPFFLGLILIVVGTGLLKPNISAIVGDLYPEGGARRDAGFSIFYMGINVGALTAPLITGVLGEKVGWHYGFGAAGVGMVLGLITYRMRAPATLGAIGVGPSTTDRREHARVRTVSLAVLGLLVGIILLAMAGVVRIDAVWVAQRMTGAMVTMVLLYFVYLFTFAGL